MENNEWKQTSHRSWTHPDGRYIVVNYCPREGGTRYTLLKPDGTTKKFRKLEEAQNV